MKRFRVLVYFGVFFAPSVLWAQQPDTQPATQTPPPSGKVKALLPDTTACPLVQAALREAIAAPAPDKSSTRNDTPAARPADKGNGKGETKGAEASPVKC